MPVALHSEIPHRAKSVDQALASSHGDKPCLIISENTFTAALIEVKRARRPEQEGVGFSRSDALVGMPARTGSVMLLENDRIRVYVIDGGKVRIHSLQASGEPSSQEEQRSSVSGRWLEAAPNYSLENVGTIAYRELSVELK